MAFGGNVGNEALAESSEVIMYFVQAEPGWKGSSRRLWLYDNAFVVELRKNTSALLGNRGEEVLLS